MLMTGDPLPLPRGRLLKGGARNSLTIFKWGPFGPATQRKKNKQAPVSGRREAPLPPGAAGAAEAAAALSRARVPASRLHPEKPSRAPLGVREATQAAAASAATTPHPAPLEPQMLPSPPPPAAAGKGANRGRGSGEAPRPQQPRLPSPVPPIPPPPLVEGADAGPSALSSGRDADSPKNDRVPNHYVVL